MLKIVSFIVCSLVVSSSFGFFSSDASAISNTNCALTWDLVASPDPGSAGNLQAVDAASATDIWAAGTLGANGTSLLLQHWNGTSWSLATAPDVGNGPNPITVTGVKTLSGSDAWVTGYYGYYTSRVPFVIQWNGTYWSTVVIPSTTDGHLDSISGTSSLDIWAVGSEGFYQGALVWHWTGTQWDAVSNPIAGISFGEVKSVVANSPTDVWMIGQYSEPDNTLFSTFYFVVVHWNGSEWSVESKFESETFNGMGGGLYNLVTGFAVLDASEIWMVDTVLPQSSHSAIQARSRVSRWNGTQWQSVDQVDGPSIWRGGALDSSGSDAIWIVTFLSQFTQEPQYPVRHWDGTTYFKDSLPFPQNLDLRAVSVVAQNDVWIVGSHYGYPNVNQPYIAHGHLPCAAVPGIPILTGPARKASVKLKPTLKWVPATGALYFEIQVSHKPGFKHPVTEATTFTSSYKLTKPLKSGKTFFWRVRACNNAGCGEWSRTRIFTTK